PGRARRVAARRPGDLGLLPARGRAHGARLRGPPPGAARLKRFEHMAYLEAGAGEPLFLLHGGTMTAEWNWSEALPLFAERFRVVAPDSAGHGDSANPRPDLRY